MKNRIEEIRKDRKPKMTQEELAELCGTTKQTIGRLAAGKQPLTTDWMEKIAKALGVEPGDLITNPARKLHENSSVKHAGRSVQIIASVQAGEWLEAFEHPVNNRKEIFISDDDPDYAYFAVEVIGDSMNMDYPEGSILVCASPHEVDIKEGDAVIVQRVKDDVYETTVKFLKVEGQRAYLMPRSTNPVHSPIVIPWPNHGGKDPKTGIDRIEIIGVVMKAIITINRKQ